MGYVSSAHVVEHLHYTMYKAAELSIVHAKAHKDLQQLYLANAYVMMAFALEAYVNDFCAVAIPSPLWEALQKRASTREKLAAVSGLLEFSVDFGCAPFQEFKTIFGIRNALAHAERRVKVIASEDRAQTIKFSVDEDDVSKALHSIAHASKLLEAVFQMVSHLHTNRPKKDVEDHPFVAGAKSHFATIVLTPLELPEM